METKAKSEEGHKHVEASSYAPTFIPQTNPEDLIPQIVMGMEQGAQAKPGQILLVIVPGALLYPKDYAQLKDSILQASAKDRDVNVNLAIAAVDWSLLSLGAPGSPEGFVGEITRAIVDAIEIATKEHGFQAQSIMGGSRYTNIAVAMHSMSVIGAYDFPMKRSAGVILLGTSLLPAKGVCASLYSYPRPVLSVYGSLDGQQHIVKAALAIHEVLSVQPHRSLSSIASRRAFCIINGLNHAMFSNGWVNHARGDLDSDADQSILTGKIAAHVVDFLKASVGSGNKNIERDNIQQSKYNLADSTTKAVTLVSSYLVALGRLYDPEEFPDGQEESISMSALRLANGAEALNFVTPIESLQFVAHPGELAEAEAFGMIAQTTLLWGLRGPEELLERIVINSTVHTSAENFIYSRPEITVCDPKEEGLIEVNIHCLMYRESYSPGGQNPTAMISPMYSLKLKSALQVQTVLEQVCPGVEFFNVENPKCSKHINAETYETCYRKIPPEFRTNFDKFGSKLEFVDEPFELGPGQTPAQWVLSQPILERSEKKATMRCSFVSTKESPENDVVSGCRYFKCPSSAWMMEWMMVAGLRPTKGSN
eukprot:jgi/Picsp_1/5844/NSC_03203-R1_unknown [Picea sitchensis]